LYNQRGGKYRVILLTNEHIDKYILKNISGWNQQCFKHTMLSRFQAMNNDKAHAVLPQSDSVSFFALLVHRGNVRSLVRD